MKRRILAIILCTFIVLLSCAFQFKGNPYVATLNVGLKNMVSNSINVVLNGDYILNNQLVPNGTSFTLTLTNGMLVYNGNSYNELIFTPQNNDTTIRLEVGAKKYNYKGTMDFRVSAKGILPINTVDIEEYLKGVVAFEMSNSYPLEALKAQAIAARNYAIANIGKHRSEGFDVCDTTDCQVYRGYNPAYTNVIKAVEDTRGMLLMYNDTLVCAYYSASSGGYLEASGNIWAHQLPYLISKKDDFENENWPYGDRKFTSTDISNTLKSKKYLGDTDIFEKIDIDSIKRNESGRVSSIDILYFDVNGTEVRKSITKEGPRTFLSLPSTFYNVVYDSTIDTYTFSGKGYGHGVGMSQIGAKNRAIAGQSFSDILTFYYDGTTIINTNDNMNVIDKDTTPGSVEYNPQEGEIDTTVVIDKPPVTTPPATTVTTPGSIGVTVITDGDDTKTQPSRGDDTKSSYSRDLKKGMTGDDVKSLQDNLKKLKFLVITKTTNYFGTATEKAVKAFQKSKNLPQTGVVDRITYDFINIAAAQPVKTVDKSTQNKNTQKDTAQKTTTQKTTTQKSTAQKSTAVKTFAVKTSLKKGMKGADVKSLQTVLKSLGYFSGQVNGLFGSSTETAVKSFQKSNGISPIGVVGPQTISKINEKLNNFSKETTYNSSRAKN